MSKKDYRDVFIVDGARTPFLKARGKIGPFTAADLAVSAGRELLARQPFEPSDIDEVVVGCIMPSAREANIARIIALRLGCGKAVPAFTVQRNCASGMQSIDSAAKDIAIGRADLVLAGGTEAMSHAPILFGPDMTNWFSDMARSKSAKQKLQNVAKFRPHYLKPLVALLLGLKDPIAGLSMGQTAENLATQFNIDRETMDAFALRSHQRIIEATKEHHLDEIVPMIANNGSVFDHDDGARADTTLERLAKLKPVFDKKYGQITPGNSSQVTDGACMLLLASADAVKKYNLPVMGRIVDAQWAALAPEVMGLGPVMASTPLLQRQKLGLDDIDYWEINEAFAAQVLACVRAWQDEDFCQNALGLPGAFGALDENRLNVDGGAVAIGHPVGTSGARIVLHLLHVLEQNNAKRGMAAICIGGGQGGAMLVERG